MTNPNDTVNPQQEYDEVRDGVANFTRGGLTKREYFAAMAMQGLVVRRDEDRPADYYSDLAVKLADALIAGLNNTEDA